MEIKYTGIGYFNKIYLNYLRYYSRHPGRRKLRRLITNSFFREGIEIKSSYGSTFSIKTFDYIDQEIIFKGSYEPLSLDLCYKLLEKGDIFFDIGANFGLYSINIARKEGTQIFAVEPNPVIFNRLKNNSDLNKLKNLTLINTAVGEGTGLACMNCQAINNSGNYQISSNKGEFVVAIVPLQDIFDKYNIQKVKLLKIDIEGFEYYAFKGINWGKTDIHNIVMEFIPGHMEDQNIGYQTCLNFLMEKGYSPYNVYGEIYTPGNDLPEHNLWLRKTL